MKKASVEAGLCFGMICGRSPTNLHFVYLGDVQANHKKNGAPSPYHYVVAPSNGAEAARRWAARVDAKPSAPRTVQRGARCAATITDYRARGRLVVTLCKVDGLGHAWSGGAAGRAYSDPKGPDASRMIWAFMAKQFASCAK